MKRFPRLADLAAADLDEVLKAWEGLGYYSRARNLHKAAREVLARFAGRVPDRVEDLLTLPGVGPYTAGAIASIAYNRDEPVLDGNVIRVLCRLCGIDADIASAATKAKLWRLARQWLPSGRAGAFNQAVMDLGATICLPAIPQCPRCPLAKYCLANRQGRQNDLPRKAASKAVPHYEVVAAVIWRGGKVLIDRRAETGLLGGLWEFPGGKIEPGETPEQALAREVAEELGIGVEVGEPLITVKHAYSHFTITMRVFHCRWRGGRKRNIACTASRWVLPKQLEDFAFPAANRKVVRALLLHPA
jgi:A/G-specific adenine glycosylase